jgi:DNA-binding SARP family transcriptional activator/tetratricopeptide (TPR) repeat protein
MDVRITLLGGFEVITAGATVPSAHWRRRHAASLVKTLALVPGRRLHREQLIDTLWPELSVEEAAPRLHKAAHYARRALQRPDSVVLAGEMVALLPDADVLIDASTFQVAAESALSARDAVAAGVAADLYRGDLLPEDPYEAWAQGARDRLRTLYLEVLRLAGRWEMLTTADPTDERAHLELIAALARRGDRRAALRQFERLERALRSELGVAPSRSAERLRQRLLAEEPGGSAAAETGAAAPAVGSGVASTGTRAPSAASGGFELVGRERERERLERLIVDMSAGQGRTLFLGGPPGIGKTAVLAWLESRCAADGIRVGSGAAAQIEGAWPYAPVLEALADLCRRHPVLLDGLDDALREEIERALSGRETTWRAQSGDQRLFVAAAELLRLAAAGAGAALVVDDAHEADDATMRLIHYLARSTTTDRVLIVIAHRPKMCPALAQTRQSLLGRGSAVTLDLTPLPYEDVSVLVRRHAPDAPADLIDAVWSTSEGLPFAVVELTRSSVDGHPDVATMIPAALSVADIEALAAAAVLGTTFDTDEFVAVTTMTEDDAYAVIESALEHRILIRTDSGYAFRHGLLRAAVLERVGEGRHRALHRQAAAALEDLERSPARIGHHLVWSGNRAAAVPWILRAAETAAALGAYRDALDKLAAVRDYAQGADLARLLGLRADLLMAGADAGAADAYREALAVTADPSLRSRLRARLARAASIAGDLDTAAIALDGLTLSGTQDDAELLLAQGHLAMARGDLEAADAAASQARLRVALGVPEEWQWFDLVGLQGLLSHTKGEWSQRLRLELRKGVRKPELATRIFDSHLCVAEFLLYGPTPYEEVLELASALRTTAERSGVLRAVAFATALRGETFLLRGDLTAAEAELSEAVELHRDIGSTAGEAHSLQRLAEVKLAMGDRIEANRLLHKALPLARFSSISVHLIQRVFGTMITAAADPDAARTVVHRAEASIGFPDRCAFCSIMLAIPAAIACADVGDIQEAEKHLRVAEKSATRWEGTAWQASLLEANAHLAFARGRAGDAARLLAEAAELFDVSSQPLDAARCRTTTLSVWTSQLAAPVGS